MIAPYVARAADRRARWRTVVTWEAPTPEDLQESLVWGTYAMIAQPSRRRWLVRPQLVRVGPWEESPGAVARDYFALTYPRWDPDAWAIRFPRQWRPPIPWQPLVARPTWYVAGVYLDVQACWWTLLQRWGWGVRYNPGRYLGYAPPVDWPFADHKVARNALVSSAGSVRLRTWTPQRGYREVIRPNRWLHIQLLHLISDVMHYLGWLALDAGAVYVHTDGYIAPTPEVAARLHQRLEEHGFRAEVRARGGGWVRGVGAYRVGGLLSGVQMAVPRAQQILRPLTDRERALLRRHLQR